MNLLACLMPFTHGLAEDAARKLHTPDRPALPTVIGGAEPAGQIDRLSVMIEALRAIRAENPPAPEHEQLTRIRSLAISISQEARVRLLDLNCDEAGVAIR